MNLLLSVGDWNEFVETYSYPKNADTIDEQEGGGLSDEEEIKFFASMGEEDKDGKKKKKKHEKEDIEPSNLLEIKKVEKTITSLLRESKEHANYYERDERFNLGFHINKRNTGTLQQNEKEELLKTRSIFSDPDVRIDGTHIIIKVKRFADEHGLRNAEFRRPMNLEELSQLDKKRRDEISKVVKPSLDDEIL